VACKGSRQAGKTVEKKEKKKQASGRWTGGGEYGTQSVREVSPQADERGGSFS